MYLVREAITLQDICTAAFVLHEDAQCGRTLRFLTQKSPSRNWVIYLRLLRVFYFKQINTMIAVLNSSYWSWN